MSLDDLARVEQWIDFREFRDWYETILGEFQYDRGRDEHAREVLSELLSPRAHDPRHTFQAQFRAVHERLADKPVVICGGGPSLAPTLERIFTAFEDACPPLDSSRLFWGAADGATRAVRAHEHVPDLVCTDLDGLTPAELLATHDAGATVVVHAHGDNIPRLHQNAVLLGREARVIGTVQCRPGGGTINPGGFTDGDRAVSFVAHFRPSAPVFLVGMDFGRVVGPYSKPSLQAAGPASPVKQRKLAFGQRIVEWWANDKGLKMYSIEATRPLRGIPRLTVAEFIQRVVAHVERV